jgi:hypothetical protein
LTASWQFDDPAFLFNIAQCFRQLDNKPEALRAYRSYLRNLPNAENSAEVNHLIDILSKAIAQTKLPPAAATIPATVPSAPAASPPAPIIAAMPPPTARTVSLPPDRQPVYKKWWVWTVLAWALA